MDKKIKYQSFQDILKFLSFDFMFDNKTEYPFNRDPKNVRFSWGQILIPKYGIREMVSNKISDIKDCPISEIKMMYQIPFMVEDKKEYNFGVINQNISLGFRYDKEYKYGEITKSIYEVCWYIVEHAITTNDFFIITADNIQYFFSYYIIANQYGIGSTVPMHTPDEHYFGKVPNKNDRYPKVCKCPWCESLVEVIDGKCPECDYKIDTELPLQEVEDVIEEEQTLKRVYKCPSCLNWVSLIDGKCYICGTKIDTEPENPDTKEEQ
jgi:hypothetical protein